MDLLYQNMHGWSISQAVAQAVMRQRLMMEMLIKMQSFFCEFQSSENANIRTKLLQKIEPNVTKGLGRFRFISLYAK